MLYQINSPVLFIVFNRPEPTAKVFEKIREAKPARLYVGADGPRANRPGEDELCRQVREIATQVDWPCELKTLFKDKNVGCKEGEASAMTWFFENEEEGIVLEDDTLPDNSFFKFCDVLLEKYRHDTRIRLIAGANFQDGIKRGEASYYFSNLAHGWGWAGWRRVWNEYDKNLNQYDEKDFKRQIANIFNDDIINETWYQIFVDTKAGKIDTWDYQFQFSNFFNNGLCVIPNNNLISNIGFGEGATHTKQTDSVDSNRPRVAIDHITHPTYFVPDKQADLYSLNLQFNVLERRRKQKFLPRRFKRWLRSLLSNK